MTSNMLEHAEPFADLAADLAWLQSVIAQRFAVYHDADVAAAPPPPPPALSATGTGHYGALIAEHRLGITERLAIMLALAPSLAPEVLDPFLLQNAATGRRFTEFGGIIGQAHGGLLPTVETLLFLVAGNDLGKRQAVRRCVSPGAPLLAAGVIAIDQRHPDEPPAAAVLRLSREYLDVLLTGADHIFTASDGFPAERITTPLDWDDLVLNGETHAQIGMVANWIRHGPTLMGEWGLARRLKPGYRCLSHGSPGTGKTLTAALLGKQFGLPVFRVDLSRVVSKWIGETEKNLAGLFDQAEHRNWILFFDEAEALFGKRTDAQSANDRAANQQIAYLLQRLEDFPGLVILATNQRGHMDEAFARRFQTSVLFPIPDAAARQRLWEAMFRSGNFALSDDIDFAALAADHALAGGAIVNVLRHACLLAIAHHSMIVSNADILAGVRQEFQKAGHYLSHGAR